MESLIAQVLNMEYGPVALLWSDAKPEGAVQQAEGEAGCIMNLVVRAAKGERAVCDQKSAGCLSGGLGIGLESRLKKFPGGPECYCYYLSRGNKRWEKGRQVGELVRMSLGEEHFVDFMEGRHYFRTPELARKFLATLPTTEIPAPYVVFAPLSELDPRTTPPQVVIFIANASQLAALTNLAGYSRTSFENVIIPQASSCQTIGIYPYRESLAIKPKAVVGLTGIASRRRVAGAIGADKLTFSVPFAMFQEMEQNVWGSFIEEPPWQQLAQGIEPSARAAE